MDMKERNLFDLLARGREKELIRRRQEPPTGREEPATLDTLARSAAGCTRCRLRQNAANVVFGQGDEAANLMFVGEGPGGDEDRLGVPFVGAAGKLLDRILDAAEINRAEVYIANIVKCRPPNNRLPQKDEVEACFPYLQEQIRLIKPEIVVCLGALSTQVLIDASAKIGRVRGTWFERDGLRIMPTYHPAALLRDPSLKRPVWEDIQKVRDAYREIMPKGVMK